MQVGHLLRSEGKLLLRNRSAQLVLAMFVLLAAWACGIGIATARQQERTIQALLQREADTKAAAKAVAKQEDGGTLKLGQFRDPRDPANYVRIVLAAPFVLRPLTAFGITASRGADLPFYYLLNTGPMSKTITAYEYTNPQLLQAGSFDLSFVVLYFLPLSLIVIGYEIWTSEKESGTARLVALSSEHAATVYLRRLLLTAALPCFVCLMAGWITIAAAQGSVGAKAIAACEYASVVLLYWAFWVGVLALVVRAAKTTAASLAVCLGVYVTLVLVVPAAVTWIATTSHPQASRADYLDLTRRTSDTVLKDLKVQTEAWLQQHPTLRSQAGVSAGAQTLVSTLLVESQTAPYAEEIARTKRKEVSTVRHLALLSPTLVAREQLDTLSGNSEERQDAFQSESASTVSSIRQFFLPILAAPQNFTAAQVDRMNHPSSHFSAEPTQILPSGWRSVEWVLFLSIPLGLWFALAKRFTTR